MFENTSNGIGKILDWLFYAENVTLCMSLMDDYLTFRTGICSDFRIIKFINKEWGSGLTSKIPDNVKKK